MCKFKHVQSLWLLLNLEKSQVLAAHNQVCLIIMIHLYSFHWGKTFSASDSENITIAVAF